MSLEATAQELHNAYWQQGETLVSLGKQYGCRPSAVWSRFRKLGIPTRNTRESNVLKSRRVTPEEAAQMVELYQQGLSLTDVGNRLGRAARLVGDHLEAAGVPRRSRKEGVRLAVANGKIRTTTLDETFFRRLTPASTWVLGLIFGDGHIANRPKIGQYQVFLAGTKQVCSAAQVLLGIDKPAKKRPTADCWILQWSSRTLVGDLGKFGLIGGSKARTMEWPSHLPKRLLPHFVRGLWDSDGGWARRGKHLRANYTCSSIRFTKSLKHMLEARGWSPRFWVHRTKLNGKKFIGYRLELLAEHSRELARWLYCDTTSSLRCERKHRICEKGG